MRVLALTALATFLVDQALKLAVVHGLNLIERGEIDVAPPYLVFRMAWNRGVNRVDVEGAMVTSPYPQARR